MMRGETESKAKPRPVRSGREWRDRERGETFADTARVRSNRRDGGARRTFAATARVGNKRSEAKPSVSHKEEERGEVFADTDECAGT